MSNIKNLDASGAEALQGLLSSLGYVDNGPSSGTVPSKEQLQKLSERINEILGDGADRGPISGDPIQLRDEEGLPIVDISEQVDENTQTRISPSPVVGHDLIPLSSLPPDEKDRRRRERDRILDLLEEEERLQQLQEERDAEEQRKEANRKRRESVKAELEQLKSAQELQRKMGRALVRDAKGTATKGQDDTCSSPRTPFAVAKKSVSFADAATNKEDQQTSLHQPDWGDVTPGRLRARSRIPLVSTDEIEKYPMKMRVVERLPSTTPTSLFTDEVDSDDEPISTEHLSRTENDSSDKSKSSSSEDEPLDEEFDYDAAQHQREIALEYLKRRDTIAAETTKAMAAHTLDDYEQREVESLSPLSRFRADRMAAAYDKSHNHNSTLIGQNVIPTSRRKSLRNSVRLGKLENDQLVGGESGESGSEDEISRDMVQMLRTGSIQNAGPDFKSGSMSTVAPFQDPKIVESPSLGSTVAARETRPSVFKSARARATNTVNLLNDNGGNNARPHPIISSVVERKAPRTFPINKPPPRSAIYNSELVPPMIIDSPSFPMTSTTLPVVSPPSSPSRPGVVSSSSLQPQPQCSPSVKPSASHEANTQPPRPSSSDEKPVSKFMVERRK